MRRIQVQKQRMQRRTLVLAISSSFLTIAIAMMIFFNIGNVRNIFAAPSKTTVTTIQDGNWSDNSIWSTGVAPVSGSGDSIVISNAVNLDIDYTVGNQTATGLTVTNSGSLTSKSRALTLDKYASLVNKGVIDLKNLDFNSSSFTDPAVNLTNTGALTVKFGFNVLSTKSVISNSGTLNLNADSKINGGFSNTGIVNVSGDFSSDYGTINNRNTINITGSGVLTGTTLNNSNENSSYTLKNDLTLNYGTANHAVSAINNSGKILVGTHGKTGTFTINDGTVKNGNSVVLKNAATFTVNGTVMINAGSQADTNSILNNGIISVSESFTTSGISKVINNDSMTIGTGLVTYSNFTTGKSSYLSIGTDFTNNYATYASFTNNGGYVVVGRNFTNGTNAIYTGSGGGLSVANNFVNHSSIGGSTDVCDKTPNTASDINGTLGSSVTTCSFNPVSNGATALPVVLTLFNANKDENKIVLDWTTACEINNDRFEIERSADGTDFTVIGSVKGNGTKMSKTNYSFDDQNPLPGIAYYRLHQFDYNSVSEYSAIAVVHGNVLSEQLSLNIYPNPAPAGKTMHLEMLVPVSGRYTVDLVNMIGVGVYHAEQQAEMGKQLQALNIPENLSGTYLMNLTYEGKTISKKIQIQ
jgi:hypothetical protein